MQLDPPHSSTHRLRFYLSHQLAGQPLPPMLLGHIQCHHIHTPLEHDILEVRNHKSNNLTASIFRNPNNSIPLLSESPHGLSIETKLLRKASLIQHKHCLKVSDAVVVKKNLATHSIQLRHTSNAKNISANKMRPVEDNSTRRIRHTCNLERKLRASLKLS
jgi:hypothetical protein